MHEPFRRKVSELIKTARVLNPQSETHYVWISDGYHRAGDLIRAGIVGKESIRVRKCDFLPGNNSRYTITVYPIDLEKAIEFLAAQDYKNS